MYPADRCDQQVGDTVRVEFPVEVRLSLGRKFDCAGIKQHRDCGHEHDREEVAE